MTDSLGVDSGCDVVTEFGSGHRSAATCWKNWLMWSASRCQLWRFCTILEPEIDAVTYLLTYLCRSWLHWRLR